MAEKTILVVAQPEPTEPQPVIERAAWLAKRLSARVELFACDYDADIDTGHVSTVWIPQPGTREKLLLRRRQALEALAEPLRKRGLEVVVDVAWDHPFGAAIVRKVLASAPWLVAKETQHHNVLQRTLLSNTDWHLIRRCPAPLLLVKSRPIAARPIVLAAIDPLHQHDKPAELDDRIFRFADSLASGVGGTLHVVHAFALPMGLDLPPDVTELCARQHREAIAGFLQTHAVAAANVHLLEGVPHECLQQAAMDRAADFVVMGAVSRRGLNRLFVGSTAERTLDRLPCDLVIIKPEGFKPPAGDSD